MNTPLANPAVGKSLVLVGLALGAQAALAQAPAALDCGLNTGVKASGVPLVVGALVGKTGPDDFSAAAAAAAAYFKCVNDNGGLHGRPVEYVVMDDQWDPKVAAQAANTLLQDRKVVAMVGSSSFVECGVNAQRYADEGVMAIAGTGVPRACFHAKAYVPLNTGPRVSATLAAMHAAKTGKVRKMVCLIPDIPGLGDWACGGVQAWGSKRGIVAETIAINPAAFSARDVMTRAASGNPDVIVMNFSKGILLPLMAASQQMDLGRRIRFVSSAPAYNDEVAKALGPYWKDNFHANLEFLPLDHSGPDTRNWQGVMARYAQKTDSRDAFSQSGYLSARLFTQAVLTLTPDRMDRSGVSQVLRRVTDFRSDMLCRPFYVGAGKRHHANSSGPMAAFNGQAWAVLPGDCLPADDPELADVRADERKMGLK